MIDPKRDDLRKRLSKALDLSKELTAALDWPDILQAVEQWCRDQGWLSPEQVPIIKGLCERCKKPVTVRSGEAWHAKAGPDGKQEKVWHEICSYQEQLEQAKPLSCGHAKDTCFDCEHIHQGVDRCDVPCWDYGKSAFRPCFCESFKCRACAEVERRIREARLNGEREGIRCYAWWKDGVQYVGTTGRTLKEALAELEHAKGGKK